MTPYWPILMTRKTAACYLDMSETSFIREVDAGRLPGAVKIGGRMHWRRDAIDAALDQLTGAAPQPDFRAELRGRYGQAA